MGRYLCVSVHHSQPVGALTGRMVDDTEPSDVAEADPPGGDGAALQSTYAWSPDASCGECGATIAARWRDGENLVCDACKSW